MFVYLKPKNNIPFTIFCGGKLLLNLLFVCVANNKKKANPKFKTHNILFKHVFLKVSSTFFMSNNTHFSGIQGVNSCKLL